MRGSIRHTMFVVGTSPGGNTEIRAESAAARQEMQGYAVQALFGASMMF